MPSHTNSCAVLAAAGSRKTERIVDEALAATGGRVLITTYTNLNQDEIVKRIEKKAGCVPAHITVMGWFSFLINHFAKPYQRALTLEPLVIGGLNFKGTRSRFTRKATVAYFIDRNGDLYRDAVADFGVTLNGATKGAIVRRLESIYTHLFVDEVQDLVGYDLDVLDLLLASRIRVMLVGDPRQHTFATNLGSRNSKYRGIGLVDWLHNRSAACSLEQVTCSYRCCQELCDFSDGIYPNLPTTKSVSVSRTGHDGVFQVRVDDVEQYLNEFTPVTILRYDKTADTKGLSAFNIGIVKGRTFDRVMIFPTKPMLEFLEHREPTRLKSPEKLYVAVTRARFSAAFVVPRPIPGSIAVYRAEGLDSKVAVSGL
jgi:hypothetical protein